MNDDNEDEVSAQDLPAVRSAQAPLNAALRRELRARAHDLKPVVMIGDAGLTPTVAAEINRSLDSHELIKIRVSGAERDDRDELFGAICERTGAAPVQHIGKMLVVYRENTRRRAEEAERARRQAIQDSRARASRPRKPGGGFRPGAAPGRPPARWEKSAQPGMRSRDGGAGQRGADASRQRGADASRQRDGAGMGSRPAGGKRPLGAASRSRVVVPYERVAKVKAAAPKPAYGGQNTPRRPPPRGIGDPDRVGLIRIQSYEEIEEAGIRPGERQGPRGTRRDALKRPTTARKSGPKKSSPRPSATGNRSARRAAAAADGPPAGARRGARRSR
jgi:RNA-binding protein